MALLMTRKNFLLSLLIFLPVMTFPPVAAAASEDQTVLYYLIEMQRRVNKKCRGAPMPEAPSLTPSEALRETAQSRLDGLPALAPATQDAPLLYLNGKGEKPQQVFNSLVASQCRELMGQGYRYIGAAGRGGRWVVVLSGADKKPEADASAPVLPALEAENSRGVKGREITDSDAYAGQTASGGKNAGTEQIGGKNTILRLGPYGPDTVRPGTEPKQAASPRVIGEVNTDAHGRPVGPIVFYDKGKAVPENDPEARDQTATPNSAGAYAGSYSGPSTAPNSAGVYGGDYSGQDTPFVPPSGPGPFAPPAGMREAPLPPRSGVVPLNDTRPPGTEEPLVYVAPGNEGPRHENPGYESSGHEGSGTYPAGSAEPALQTPASQSPRHMRTSSPVSGSAGNLLELINAERAAGRMCGNTRMPPSQALRANPLLARAAQKQAEDMSARGYFSSTTPEGVTPGLRLTEAGYAWSFIAENIARMEGGAEAALRGWLKVESRCENLMGPEYFEAGVGYDPVGRNWVLTLAAPMP